MNLIKKYLCMKPGLKVLKEVIQHNLRRIGKKKYSKNKIKRPINQVTITINRINFIIIEGGLIQ